MPKGQMRWIPITEGAEGIKIKADRIKQLEEALTLCAYYGHNSEKGKEGRRMAKKLLTK